MLMKVSFLLALMVLIGVSAVPAMADGSGSTGDPTIIMNKQATDPPCVPTAGLVCVDSFSDLSLTVPAGAFSLTLDYTGLTDVDEVEMLFVNPGASITCQTDIFQTCSSLPEVQNGLPALLLDLFGSGPCQSNGANNPAETCSGVIQTGDLITFSSPDGFSHSQVISFTPEPGTLLLLGSGLTLLGRFSRKRGLKRPA
jgi:hypothetical protein